MSRLAPTKSALPRTPDVTPDLRERHTPEASDLPRRRETLDASITPVRNAPSTLASGNRRPDRAGTPRAVKPAHLTASLRQFASLLNAGLPLIAALDVLEAGAPRPAVSALLSAVRRDVTQGVALSHALARHPRWLDEQHRALIAVGEASGSLAAVLLRIADERSRAAAQRARLRAALTYPTCLLVFALTVVTVLARWVIPTFEEIFASFNAALPPATQAVIEGSHAIASGLPYGLGGVIAAYCAWAAMLRRSRKLRDTCARHVLIVPLIGAFIARRCVARWCRALGILLHAGVPLADALDILSRTSGHPSFDRATADASARIRRGERLSFALASCSTGTARPAFPPSIVGPVAIAEQTGALDAVLMDLADMADHDLDAQIASVLSLLEPALVAVLGLLIGGIVLTLYLPIIELGHAV
ncbi:Type II secretion system F family protein [Pararobbsia alpina]|uniref:type II secretion system F family protein n=1 Tax=Pararobbsia alpina TaxID=621374 RepID=UPI0039A57A33